MRIRVGGPGDAGALAEVYRASVQQLAADHYDEEQRQAWAGTPGDAAGWCQRLQGLDLLVAERLGETAGFIGFRADGYIDLLFTAPGHARRGVARALFDVAERQLLAAGTCTLHTHASRVARPFFARQGFRVVGAEYVRLGATRLERFEMRKDAPGA